VRSVIHWDGDRFFASIEQASDKRLRRRPVAVGGAGRGVVISASAEARRYGVRPGLPVGKARRMCGPLVVVPAHFDLYEQFSRQIIGLCQETTPLVEPVAVGAAYLDLTGTRALLGQDPLAVVGQLRRTVGEWLRVSISAGLGTTKTVARIAARLRKPGGQVTVAPGDEAAFLAPLPLGWLPGMSGETLSTLQVAGLGRVGELARAPLDALELVLGRRALAVQRLAQGVDEDPVRPPKAADPQWRETVEFPEDVWEEPRLLYTLRGMLERLMTRLRTGEVEARRLTLAVRYTDRAEAERSLTLAEPSALEIDFFPLLEGLLRGAWQRRVRLRTMTLRAGRIYRPSPQLSLFEAPRTAPAACAAAIDALRRVYGERAVMRGWQWAAPVKARASPPDDRLIQTSTAN